MVRNTHNRQLDHEDVDLDTNVVLDGALSAPASTASGDTVHQALEDLNTAITTSTGSGGTNSILTGDDSEFTASLGSWAATNGTMTRDTGIKMSGFTASLKFVSTGAGSYVEVPVSGTFTSGKTYWGLILVSTSNNDNITPQLGLIGTDSATGSTIPLNSTDTADFVALAVGWVPTADRTGVKLRVANVNAKTMYIGWALVFQSDILPTITNRRAASYDNIYLPRVTNVSSPLASRLGHRTSPQLALWGNGSVDINEVSNYSGLSLATNGVLFWGQNNAGNLADGGIDIEVGDDYLGFYISEKNSTTIQMYPDVSGGYDIELVDRGSGKFWYAVNTSGQRVPLSALMNGGMNIEFGTGAAVIPTGIAHYAVELPFAGVWTSNRLLADQSGSMTITIKKSTYSGYAGSLTSIVASAKPTLSSAIKSEDTTLTGWTTTFSAGDILRFEVDTASTVTKATLSLRFRRT